MGCRASSRVRIPPVPPRTRNPADLRISGVFSFSCTAELVGAGPLRCLTVRELSAQSRVANKSTQGLLGFWEGLEMRTTLRVWLTGFPRRLARQALILDVADHRAA